MNSSEECNLFLDLGEDQKAPQQKPQWFREWTICSLVVSLQSLSQGSGGLRLIRVRWIIVLGETAQQVKPRWPDFKRQTLAVAYIPAVLIYTHSSTICLQAQSSGSNLKHHPPQQLTTASLYIAYFYNVSMVLRNNLLTYTNNFLYTNGSLEWKKVVNTKKIMVLLRSVH